MPTTIGEYIAERMRDKNMSQTDLAERAKIGSGSVSRILSGKQQPTKEMLRKIAAALDVAVATLLDVAGTPVTRNVPMEDQALWELIQAARTDAEKNRLLRRLQSMWADDPSIVARIQGYLDGLEHR